MPSCIFCSRNTLCYIKKSPVSQERSKIRLVCSSKARLWWSVCWSACLLLLLLLFVFVDAHLTQRLGRNSGKRLSLRVLVTRRHSLNELSSYVWLPFLPFVLSFIHSFIHSFKHSFIHSFIHSFMHAFITVIIMPSVPVLFFCCCSCCSLWFTNLYFVVCPLLHRFVNLFKTPC